MITHPDETGIKSCHRLSESLRTKERNMMRAWQVDKIGTIAQQRRIAPPEPGPRDVLIKVAACGLNFADLLMQDGKYQEHPSLPYVPGLEFAGTVIKLGVDVKRSDHPDISLGQRVCAFAGSGGLAETACVPVDRLVLMPDSMSFAQAAAFQIAYGTSHLALHHRARLQPGETLLVLGAAGGVGLTAVEIGKKLGARVIACARGAEKLAIARTAGADVVIDSDAGDLRGTLKALGGIDVVYDPVGGPGLEAALSACKPEGRLLTIGFASGAVPQIAANRLLVKNLTVIGLYWGGYLTFAPQVLTGSLNTLVEWFADGSLKPHVSHTLPFDHYPEGLELLHSRQATGKVVITLPQ